MARRIHDWRAVDRTHQRLALDMAAARRMVGRRVRWHHLPHETPMTVTGVTATGMLELEGWSGAFAHHLFVVVEDP